MRFKRDSVANGGQVHINPGTATVLSILPGLGQIYNLQPRKGIIFLAVGLTNLLILTVMAMSSQLMGQLETFGREYNVLPNQQLVVLFSDLNLLSPAVVLVGLLFLAFVAFAMRDAHDIACRAKRKAIYADEILELSEANSASYLLHISAMVSFLILAFFFLIPPQPKQQITSIEFIQPEDKAKPQPKPKPKEKISTQSQKAQRNKKLDRDQPQLNKSSSRTKPQQVQKVEPKPAVQKPAETKPAQPSFRPTPNLRPQRSASNPTPLKPPIAPRNHPTPNPMPSPTQATPTGKGVPDIAQKLLAMNPVRMPGVPISAAPVKLDTASAPKLPGVRESKVERGGGITPQIKESTNAGRSGSSSTRTPVAINTGNKGSEGANNGPKPAAARSHSGRSKSADNLISIKPNLGSARPGNSKEIREGSSPKGIPAERPITETGDDVDFGPYMANLQRRIRQAWFPPRDQLSKRVKVIFTIHTNGTMSNLRLMRSSGSAIADRAAQDAVRKAAPFQRLPKGAPASVDVEFTFDYNVFKGGRAW